MPPDVSVVIATRERWPWLERTLAALAEQCVESLEFEVVVADAMSADGSWESLERFAATAVGIPFRLTAVQAPGFGGALTRNTALGAAAGELVLLLADDARPASPTLIAGHVAAHAERRSASAISGGLAWDDGEDRLADSIGRSGAVGDDRGWLGGAPLLQMENCSIPRTSLVAADGFDERLTGWNVEGVELSWRLLDTGVALERRDDLLVLRSKVPDARRWLAEIEDVGRQVDLLDRLHPGRRTPGPRGVAALLARAGHPLARRLPGLALARRSALARGRGRAALPAVPERRGGVRPAQPLGPRPGVSVVIPFHGDRDELRRVLAAVARLRTGPGDEVIVADNTPDRISARESPEFPVRFVHADAEQSAPHARNVGAEASGGEWMLFMDADCRPAPGLLDAYFAPAPGEGTGAVAGAILDPVDQPRLASRYSASRERLGQAALLAHPHMPAAVTANLLVRRRTWEELGGLCEGIRSEEDLDFCWRMQQAGWKLEHRPGAAVEHRHRETLRGVLRQAQRFGRGFAWQDRRYPGSRITGHLLRRLPRLMGTALFGVLTLRAERAAFAVLDAAVAGAEVSGRLRGGVGIASGTPDGEHADLVLVVDTYGDVWNAPLVRDARALRATGTAVRIEARRRGHWLDRSALRDVAVSFSEDDGSLTRLAGLIVLALRHPVRCASSRGTLAELAPIASRLRRSGARHLHATGGGRAPQIAADLAYLTGLSFSVHVDGTGELAGGEEALARAGFLTAPSAQGASALRAGLPAGAPEIHVLAHATPSPGGGTARLGDGASLVVAGRLERCAGLDDLVAAVALLRTRGVRVRLRVLGEGPARRELAEAAAGSGIADVVELPGIRQPAQTLDELARTDVLVVPRAPANAADWPPAVVVEALAAGCAIVDVDCGPEALAAAIEAALERGGDRDAARPVAEAAEPRCVAAQLVTLVEAATARR